MNAILSSESHRLSLPSNFLEVSANLSAPALRLALTYFQFMAAQSQDSSLCLAFDLKNAFPAIFEGSEVRFDEALNELLQSRVLLSFNNPEAEEQLYLLPGTEEGAALLEMLQSEPDKLRELKTATVFPAASRPTVYKLYEENIGPLTPYTAELLRDAAQSYSEEWLEDAIKEAVHYNARSWRYVQAILTNWQEKGRKRSNEEDKRDHESFRQLYLEQKRKSGH